MAGGLADDFGKQIYRRAAKKGIEFTLMVAGQPPLLLCPPRCCSWIALFPQRKFLHWVLLGNLVIHGGWSLSPA